MTTIAALPSRLLYTKADVYLGPDVDPEALIHLKVRFVLQAGAVRLYRRGALLEEHPVLEGERLDTKNLRLVIDTEDGPVTWRVRHNCGCGGR